MCLCLFVCVGYAVKEQWAGWFHEASVSLLHPQNSSQAGTVQIHFVWLLNGYS